MIAAVREFANRFLGRGEATITVPSFDGALKPNQKLEAAETLFSCDAPEDLASAGGRLYLADGRRLLRLDESTATELRTFDQPISALCALPDGGLAVALAGREVRLYSDPASGEATATFADPAFNAINALALAPDGTLIATDGSASCGVDDWARDLMELNRSGRVYRLDPKSRSVTQVAGRLGYAFGACAASDGVFVSESWRHRLMLIAPDGSSRVVLGHLPVYPSRLSRASGGGYWLTAFTARTQLVEFVLREPAFRRRMMAEIDPSYWVAPRVRSGQSFKEPMQGAHIKTMGVIKPWAPPRSYGLVIRLSEEGVPLYSLHSRVDGVNHGIVAAIESGTDLVIIAKGPGRVLRLPLAALTEEFGA
ncbi:SMP-30/gluconolactonase/LRE family protein [Bradyrhizobium genosp. P]|uniref:SMP-30/gluconolactonase/LRE family protein n=1 Tax=Bradyrhizobium genosp. P TaxID=83641 RepID=UPI003CF11EE8